MIPDNFKTIADVEGGGEGGVADLPFGSGTNKLKKIITPSHLQ